MEFMTLPYQEPLTVRQPGPRIIPEPPRRGEPGGDPCGICTAQASAAVWSDDLWSLQYTIAAGTSQIQRNLIAERILGMPKSA